MAQVSPPPVREAMLAVSHISFAAQYSAGNQASKPPISDEIKLLSTTNLKERQLYDNMAELYSIVKTTDLLERAYAKDKISAAEYEQACWKLIEQFKTAQSLIPGCDVKGFIKEWKMECPAAEYRLLEVGRPATIPTTDQPIARVVAETVQHFITAMDSLKLDMKAVDQLQPYIQDIIEGLNRIAAQMPNLPPDWEPRVKIKNWLVILNKMKASDELAPDQIRQLLFDLEGSYSAFHKSLSR